MGLMTQKYLLTPSVFFDNINVNHKGAVRSPKSHRASGATCGESCAAQVASPSDHAHTHTHTHTTTAYLGMPLHCNTHFKPPPHTRVLHVYTHVYGTRRLQPPPLMQAFCPGFSPSASHFCCSLLLFAQASSSIKSAPRTASECAIAFVRSCLSASRTTLL